MRSGVAAGALGVTLVVVGLAGCRQHRDPAVAEAQAQAAVAEAQARAAEARARVAELHAKAAAAKARRAQREVHEGAEQSRDRPADAQVKVGATLHPALPGPAGGAGAEITRVVRRHRGRVTRCYARIAKQDRDFAMRKLKLDVEFDLGADGRVSAARVGGLGGGALDQQLSTCIVEVFKRMRLPAQAEPRTVRQRYVFTAGPRR